MVYYSEKPASGLGGKNMLVEPKWGDIFYVSITNATGHEMDKTRPAVVVSDDRYNRVKNCVVVVLLSASSNQNTGEVCRVPVRSTPKKSTGLCDQVTTVDKTRLGTWMGRATDHEMTMLAVGLMDVLKLGQAGLQDDQKHQKALEEQSDKCRTDLIKEYERRAMAAEEKADWLEKDTGKNTFEVVRVTAERDTYKELYEKLLGKVTRRRNEGA